ncbi:LacI family DNA-binding transcriptional regulator [Simiduia curdlanivorans]|uniref:LacI family DNA-binding transcriptional regulator n=1 Tax=Simiduia curdlanivorans TaxID=1492769 RepID=A0ABV8V7H2_9GAMM|nr:LacI family DNA-binding transcriptional regulator [Simiduia curdlanivorans]MDN3638726.1 LacI family DNA-binding transcriptional regulator [Simiduia curdlanivorans]
MADKPNQQYPQMSDIARLAGVSKSTVSRALSGSNLVNQQTRDLVMKIAKEQNYRLNTAARNFRLKESLTIAVLLPSAIDVDFKLSDPFFLELLAAIAEAVDEHGHQLLLSRIAPQEGEWIEAFVDKRAADGVILIGQGSHHDTINRIASRFKAISVWGAKISDDQSYPVVGSDNILGGRRAAEHLLSRARKRIVFLGYKSLPEVLQRYQGYCAALEAAGLSVLPELVVEGCYGEADGYSAMSQLIDSGLVFDGVFAVSDVLAMSAIRALQENGRAVPAQVSVVGYDDISLAAYYNPPLTTVHQNLTMGGKVLVDNLLEALEGRAPEFISLNPNVVVRGSS